MSYTEKREREREEERESVHFGHLCICFQMWWINIQIEKLRYAEA